MRRMGARRLLMLGTGIVCILLSATFAVYAVAPFDLPFGQTTSAKSSRYARGNRVIIPMVGVDVRVTLSRRSSALRRGAWMHSNAGRPGNVGTTVIAGHRIPSQFRRLQAVKRGYRVFVYWRGRRHLYRVTSVKIVRPGRMLVKQYGDRERLVLYTCLPRWAGNRRRVVYARPVGKR